MLNKRKATTIALIGLLAMTVLQPLKSQSQQKDLPNILWITSEDNSDYFIGCYGNTFATTPNLDQLASEGFLYSRAYANCPVCSPARNTIISGIYAASNGNEQMRSTYAMTEVAKLYPEYLRDAGYYCTNNYKTDYNYNGDYNAIWDACSNKAHYNNRKEGQPFFAVFNLMTTHESMIHRQIPTEELNHDPEKVVLPPYHPDTPEMRHDWAQYFDRNEQMDAQVGELLKELEESGQAENTIVFYYGDHGGALARSKRFIYETGTKIPFIIRIPEKFKDLYPAAKPGDKVDRLVSFVDLVPTLLSITGIPLPDYLQGDAFLGDQKTAEPEYLFMTRQRMDERYDMVRAVRDKQYRYIRNYMPFRITMQHLDYLFQAPSAQSWEDAFIAGETNEVQSRYFLEKPVEELYDTENDPWEVNNLADDPRYADVLDRMREAETTMMQEIKDAGVIPETEYADFSGDKSLYDYLQSDSTPYDEMLNAAQLATSAGAGDIDAYTSYLESDNSAIRYWGAVGLLIHRENAMPAKSALEKAANDKSGAVATMAAETLYRMGQKELATNAYIRILTDTVTFAMPDRNFALNSIDAIDAQNPELIHTVTNLYESQKDSVKGFARYSVYDFLMSETLLKKWGELE